MLKGGAEARRGLQKEEEEVAAHILEEVGALHLVAEEAAVAGECWPGRGEAEEVEGGLHQVGEEAEEGEGLQPQVKVEEAGLQLPLGLQRSAAEDEWCYRRRSSEEDSGLIRVSCWKEINHNFIEKVFSCFADMITTI